MSFPFEKIFRLPSGLQHSWCAFPMMGKADGYGTFLRAYRNFPRRTNNIMTIVVKHIDKTNVSHDPPITIASKDILNDSDQLFLQYLLASCMFLARCRQLISSKLTVSHRRSPFFFFFPLKLSQIIHSFKISNFASRISLWFLLAVHLIQPMFTIRWISFSRKVGRECV